MNQKKNTYKIAGQEFDTKKALVSNIKKILHKYIYNEDKNLEKEDFLFILDVLKLHPNYEQKKGVGIESMCVKQNPVYKGNHTFYLIRNDGTCTDFSYIKCLYPSNNFQKYTKACRVAIEPQIMEFKQKFFDEYKQTKVMCPIRGEEINFFNCHVDHKSPKTFDKLVNDFIEENQINIDTIRIDGEEDNKVQHTLNDSELKEKWISYHRKYSVLQVVSKKANLSNLQRGSKKIRRQSQQCKQ